MGNVAELSLCKELYELSGWETGKSWDMRVPAAGYEPDRYTPKYGLGYLLRKLPKYIGYASQSCRLGLFPQGFTNTGASDWCASYDTYKGEIYLLQTADTPEDAVAKLCIELFKQGILTKEPA